MTGPAQARTRLPSSLDVDSLRSSVDAALRLLGEDLRRRCEASMEAQKGPEWAINAALGQRDVSKADPAFWLAQLLNPNSPGRRNFPAWHDGLKVQLQRAIQVRNRHYHFAEQPDSSPVDVAQLQLSTLNILAASLRLPCKQEIRSLAETIIRLRSGDEPHIPTVAEATALHDKMQSLNDQVTAAQTRAVKAEEEAELARDEAARVSEELQAYAGSEAEASVLRERLSAANTTISVLAAEAEGTQAVQRQLEQQIQELSVRQLQEPAFAPLTGEVLARLFAIAVAAARPLDNIAGQLSAIEGPLAEELASLEQNVKDFNAGIVEHLEALFAYFNQLGVSEHHTHIPSGIPYSVWLHGHVVAYRSMIDDASLRCELDLLDEASRTEVENLLRFGDTMLLRVDERMAFDARVARVVAAANASTDGTNNDTEPQDAEPAERVRLGEAWPYPRGDDVWVLSSLRREVRRPKGRPGRLGDSIGHVREQALVTQFLECRPEGGRIWIDFDGDVCTLAGEQLIYLGRIGDDHDDVANRGLLLT